MIWPFNRKKKTPPPSDPEPPKINEDWAPGDIAECINDDGLRNLGVKKGGSILSPKYLRVCEA